MKIRLFLLIAACITIIFSSCQKEINFTASPAPPIADTVLIKSVIYFDTTKAVGLDTIYKIEFWYDNKKRVIRSFSAEYEYLPTGINTIAFYDELFYLGNESRPYKSTQKQASWDGLIYDFHFYNTDKKRIKDSVFFSPNTLPVTEATVSYFSKKDQNVFQLVEKNIDFQTGVTTTTDSVLYKRNIVGGNITSAFDTVYYPTFSYSTKQEYLFDNKKNPFIFLTSAAPYLGDCYFTGDGYILPFGQNNATDIIDTDNFGGANTQLRSTLVYTYRIDGFPKWAKIAGNGNTSANKVIFNYY